MFNFSIRRWQAGRHAKRASCSNIHAQGRPKELTREFCLSATLIATRAVSTFSAQNFRVSNDAALARIGGWSKSRILEGCLSPPYITTRNLEKHDAYLLTNIAQPSSTVYPPLPAEIYALDRQSNKRAAGSSHHQLHLYVDVSDLLWMEATPSPGRQT